MTTRLRLTSGLLTSGFAVIAAGLLAAAAHSGPSARPTFAPTYVGTVTGTLRVADRTDTWAVSGLTFRLLNARFARGRWGGTYLARAGRVTFTSKGTGECRYTKTGSLSLGRLPWTAASISFLQNMRGTGYSFQAARRSRASSRSLGSAAPAKTRTRSRNSSARREACGS